MVSTTTSAEDKKMGKCKKKTVTCYKCIIVGHYSNECQEDETLETGNKKISRFLVLNHNSSSDDEVNDGLDSEDKESEVEQYSNKNEGTDTIQETSFEEDTQGDIDNGS